MAFAGDFWQLPPLKRISIYAGPFAAEPFTEEWRALGMFWAPEDVGGVQKTFILAVPARAKDRWLRAVLGAN